MNEKVKINTECIDSNSIACTIELPKNYIIKEQLNENKFVIQLIKPDYPKTIKECIDYLNVTNDSILRDLNNDHSEDVYNLLIDVDKFNHNKKFRYFDFIAYYQMLLIANHAYVKLYEDWLGQKTVDKYAVNIINFKCEVIELSNISDDALYMFTFPDKEITEHFINNFEEFLGILSMYKRYMFHPNEQIF